mgnify:CR=1 FL=1
MVEKEKIIDVLKQCFDPEIPVDLWNLGLIYDIKISEAENKKSNIDITMTLTTPGCSMGSYMADDIKMKLSGVKEIGDVSVDVTFDPPWKPEMMNDEARERLGFPVQENPAPESSEEKEREWE